MKKQSDLSRLMGYAGNYRYFTYASWVLSAASALVALVPFVYIWKILRDVLNAAPDYAQAVNIPHSQREESIEGQIRECTAYAEKNGFTVVKHYIDRAVSAKTDNRPQFQQMIKDSERGIFDIIIVWKLDRFARNRYDSARYKTQLKRNGVKLVSATEVISAGPEGIILESVLEGYAEYYSADLSEKVVRGMTENALKGIYNGGTIPFGYMIDETRHNQYAERYPDGHSDQLHQGAAGSAGRTAEGTASPHCRGTAGQAEDERRIRPVLAAPFP